MLIEDNERHTIGELRAEASIEPMVWFTPEKLI